MVFNVQREDLRLVDMELLKVMHARGILNMSILSDF